jgi:hypothetical protein
MMRRNKLLLSLLFVAVPLTAQTTPSRTQPGRVYAYAQSAEYQVKQAAEALAGERKVYENDLAVLQLLRTADVALTDPMQPANALQKAYESVDKAKSLGAEFLVMQGIIRMHHELDAARRSTATAEFPRLRAVLREHALGPASRVAVRNALKLEQELMAWLRVQQVISDHLRSVSAITGESLRAAEQP